MKRQDEKYVIFRRKKAEKLLFEHEFNFLFLSDTAESTKIVMFNF